MPTVVEKQDEYLGRLYGNVLDEYDSPSYNLRLYLLRDPDTRNIPEDYELTPENGVIIAQTGVTGTQIDDLRIKSFYNRVRGAVQTAFEFNMYQPGAADLIDQINMARAFLDIPRDISITMFLEIVFKGYEADPDNEDQGGAPVTIAGPYRYKLSLRQFDFSINSSGTEYRLEAVETDALAYMDVVYRLPKDITTTGSTITEHAQSLQDELNRFRETATADEITDEFVIDVSQLLKKPQKDSRLADGSAQDFIQDQALITSTDSTSEDLNRRINEVQGAVTDSIDAREQEAQDPTDAGNQTEVTLEGDRLSSIEDRTIYEYFLILLSMNPEFYSKISRRQEFGDPESEIDHGRGAISWLKILSQVEVIGENPETSTVARRYTFIPVLYKTARTDMIVYADELNYDADQGIERIRQLLNAGMIYKSYNYIFTGANDQIIDINMENNIGQAILAAPGGGKLGDSSTTNSNTTAPSVPLSEDISLTGQKDFVNAVRDLVNRNSLVNTLTNLGDLFSGSPASLTQLATDAASFLGRSPAEVSAALTDITGQSAQALLSELDSRAINQLNAGIQINPPESLRRIGDQGDPEVTPPNPDGSEYTTEGSGFLFAADFLNPQQTPDLEELLDRGFIDFTKDINQATDLREKTETSQSARSSTEDATYRLFRPDNTLFGYLVNQEALKTRFFIELTMTVRGDPWYLGVGNLVGGFAQGAEASLPERKASLYSVPEALAFERDDACIWFTLRSPRRYDPDWTDEDSELNSGFWRFDDVNRSMSGLYLVRTFECVFSGGVFTVEIDKAVRQIPVNRIGNRPVVEPADLSDDSESQDELGPGSDIPPVSPDLPGEPAPGSDPLVPPGI